MKSSRLFPIKFFALLFILPGLAGLVVSATVSAAYLEDLPRQVAVEQLRTVPRSIDGVVVYQTEQEDRELNQIEYGSVGVLLIGIFLGVVYLEKWGARQTQIAAEEKSLIEIQNKGLLRLQGWTALRGKIGPDQ